MRSAEASGAGRYRRAGIAKGSGDMDDIINPKVDLTESEDLQNEQDEHIKALQGTIQGACEAYWCMSDAFAGAVRSAREHKATIEDTRQMYARLAKRYRAALAEIERLKEARVVDGMLLTQRQTEVDAAGAQLAETIAVINTDSEKLAEAHKRIKELETEVASLKATAGQHAAYRSKTHYSVTEHESIVKPLRAERLDLRERLAQSQQALVLALSRLAIVEPDVDGWKQARATLTEQFGTQFAARLDRKGHAVEHVITEVSSDTYVPGTPLVNDRAVAKPNFAPPKRILPPAG